MAPEFSGRKRTVLEIVAYIIVFLLVIFYIDAGTPLGLMVWILYFIPLFLTLYIRWKFAPFVTTGIIMILIAATYFISPRDMSAFFALMNRIFFSLMLLAVATFIWIYNRNMEDLWIAEERYRFMTECSSDSIIVYKKGKILYVNRSSQRLFGAKTEKDLIGKDIIGLFDPAEQQGIRDKINQSLMGVRTVLDKVRIVRLDGVSVSVHVSFGKVIWDGEAALLTSIHEIEAV